MQVALSTDGQVGPLSTVFSARSLGLTGELGASAQADYLSGLLEYVQTSLTDDVLRELDEPVVEERLAAARPLKVPHVGWNGLRIVRPVFPRRPRRPATPEPALASHRRGRHRLLLALVLHRDEASRHTTHSDVHQRVPDDRRHR